MQKSIQEKTILKRNILGKTNNLKGTIKDVCKAGDYMFECEKGETLKRFKEDYNITSFVTSKYEENKGKVNTFVKEMQSIYKDRVKNEVRKHNDINEDINFLQETDYIFRPVQENIISTYENETQTREKPRVIDFLKNKIYHLLERIENLIHLQDFLHIERKNQIEIEENKRTHNLIIKDNDYYKKQERQKDDIDLELWYNVMCRLMLNKSTNSNLWGGIKNVNYRIVISIISTLLIIFPKLLLNLKSPDTAFLQIKGLHNNKKVILAWEYGGLFF